MSAVCLYLWWMSAICLHLPLSVICLHLCYQYVVKWDIFPDNFKHCEWYTKEGKFKTTFIHIQRENGLYVSRTTRLLFMSKASFKVKSTRKQSLRSRKAKTDASKSCNAFLSKGTESTKNSQNYWISILANSSDVDSKLHSGWKWPQ